MNEFIEVHKIDWSYTNYREYTIKIALNLAHIIKVYVLHLPCGEDNTFIETVEERFRVQESYDDVMKMLNSNDEIVKHGQWIYDVNKEYFKCSVCNKGFSNAYLYCPNCGAKMDKGSDINGRL